MRCLGEIENRKSVEQFVAYLLTQGITTHIGPVDEFSDHWEIWVREEDRLNEALQLLTEFKANPRDAKYERAVGEAKELLSQQEKSRQRAAKNLQSVRGGQRLSPGNGVPPLTLTLILLSGIVSLLSNFGKPGPSNEWGSTILNELSFVAEPEYSQTNQDPAASLKKGELWRAITPIFIHLSPLHLAFNVFAMVMFGRIIERWMGTPRYAFFVLLLAVGPNLLQGLTPESLHGSPFFGGISGVAYGLFGYVWIRSSLNPTHGIAIPPPMVILMVGSIVIGMSGLVKGWHMADLAHLGGLVIGSGIGFISERE